MNRINGYLDSFAAQAGYRQHGGIWSGISRGDTFIGSSGTIEISGYQGFHLHVFGGSGHIEYRQGPYEALAMKETFGNPNGGPAGDGFWPIPHSGNVRDMTSLRDIHHIGRNFLLLDTDTVETNSAAITFVAGNRKFTVATEGFLFPLYISGQFAPPTAKQDVNQNDIGDIAFMAHGSVILNPSITYPTNLAETQARALGPGTLAIQTGSGVINVSTGSGIAMFTGGYEYPQTPLLLTGRQRVPLQEVTIADSMIVADGVYSGVRFMAPGLYKVDYSVSIEKRVGTTARAMNTWAILLNPGAERQFPVPSPTPIPVSGSFSYAVVTNTQPSCVATMAKTFLVNANAGQFLALEVGTVRSAAAGQDVNILGSGTTCVIQYIGPKRSGF